MRIPLAALGVACLVLVACRGASTQGVTPQPTANQQGYFPPIPAASEFDTTPERSDKRRLILGTCPGNCRPGPMASIHPRLRAASWSSEQRDRGEVIARIISDSAYPKFNIHGRDTVYWAVVKRGGSLVSIFRSTAAGSKDLVTRTEVISHPEGFFGGVAYARFLWSDRDDMVWGTCDGGACCKSDGFQ